jgi:hypothetical protein
VEAQARALRHLRTVARAARRVREEREHSSPAVTRRPSSRGRPSGAVGDHEGQPVTGLPATRHWGLPVCPPRPADTVQS